MNNKPYTMHADEWARAASQANPALYAALSCPAKTFPGAGDKPVSDDLHARFLP